MELYFLTRGKKEEVDCLVDWLRTRSLPMELTDAAGKKSQAIVECQLRPVQLWSYVFPRENKDLVINTLGLPSGNPSEFKDGKYTYNINPKLWALRKLLGAKEIEKPKDPTNKMFMPYDRWKNVNILGVGIREDGDIPEMTHERL